MKKVLVTSLLFLIIGFILGDKLYNAKYSIKEVFSEGQTYYFIQEGVYTSKEIMEENTKNLSAKIIDHQRNNYYVYLGITKEEDIAKKIKAIHEQNGVDVYIKEVRLNNEEFSSNITQFDLLLNSTNDPKEIITITEVVLASYEEIIKK